MAKKQGTKARLNQYYTDEFGKMYSQSVEDETFINENGEEVTRKKIITEEIQKREGWDIVTLPERHKFANGGFITVFQDALLTILQHGRLSKLETNLLLYVLATAGVDGSIETNLDVISDMLGAKKPNVSIALKGLVQRNIIIRKDGNRYDRSPLQLNLKFNYDQINYNLAYNGKTKLFQRKKAEHPALSVPGELKGEWIDGRTGEHTIESKGCVQNQLPFSEEDHEL